MLIEMSSPVFKEKGEQRPAIQFKEGLNVVLGKEDGENSIGKSSAMLAIDFVFGGNTYLSSDGVKHIGDHTIFFAFQFDGQKHYFARNTGDADNIHVCTEVYELTGAIWTRQQYADWLKANYHIDFDGLSFRTTLSSFFRVYSKDNVDERRPLRGITGQNMQGSIEMLVKLFDRYKDIEPFNQKLTEQRKKLDAYREARRYRFVSDLVGGKTQYEENVALIKELEKQLETLIVEQTDVHSSEDIERSQIKSQLVGEKLRLETEVQAKKRRLGLLNMSLEYGLYPTEADISSLQEYFPGVNIRKLYEVEGYHRKLAKILDDQFSAERSDVTVEIASLQEQIKTIQNQISDMGFIGNISKEFLDRHSEIKARIDALKTQNDAYLTLIDLQDTKKRAEELLRRGIESILAEIEETIDTEMKRLNRFIFNDGRKAPNLKFYAYNSYHFETPDDTGTGSNYKGMVIYDLAVLLTTALPAIAHDSLILKNISDVAIDGIMRIYEQSTKQVFIAFDKQAAYPQNTRRILEENRVLQLSDNGCELYGESWNKEERVNHENELQ